MDRNNRRLVFLIMLAFLISIACGISSPTVSNVPGWPETAAAQTWSVMQTSAFLSATPTFTPLPATDTPVPTDTPQITNTPTPTHTLIPVLTQRPTNTPTFTPTPTRIPPTATRIPGGGGSGGSGGGGTGGGGSTTPCYAAELVRHVTIPNGQIIPPNTTFTKIWRIRNVGSCNWPSGSYMVPTRNNLWVGTATRNDARVRPGDTADYAVTLTSPTSAGDFTGDWLIRVDSSTRLDPVDRASFRVRITVASPASGVLWNFVDNLCTARWRTNNNRTLNCPGNPNNQNAFVLRVAPATIEGGLSTSAAIWSQPAASQGANITGTFPGLYIQGNERFRASVGCLQNFSRCNVRMQIYYRLLGGNDILINTIEEVNDGTWHTLVNNFSLAPFAGNYVTFLFKVTAINQREPAAAWFDAVLYR